MCSLQYNLDTDRTLKSLKEIIQIWHPRKKRMERQVRAFENYKNWTLVYKDY